MIEPQNFAMYILPGSVACATAVALWPRKEAADDKPGKLEVHFCEGFDGHDRRSQSGALESFEYPEGTTPSANNQTVTDNVPIESWERENESTNNEAMDVDVDIVNDRSNTQEHVEEVASDDEPTYFGTEPLTEAQRLAAREKWAAQIAEEEHTGDIPVRSNIVDGEPEMAMSANGTAEAELPENNEAQDIETQPDTEHSVPITEIISQFINNSTPEFDEILVAAFGIDESLRLPILDVLTKSSYPANVAIYRRAVDENRSIEEVWTAIDGLQKHECTEPLDQLLSYPSPLPAKALLALLPYASRDDYETYLYSRVSIESARDILKTLEPMLAL